MKYNLSIFSLCITLLGSLCLGLFLLISDTLYPNIDSLIEMPLYLIILLLLSLIIITLGLVLSAIFKNKDNTRIVELIIEVVGINLGIILMFCSLIRNESNAKVIVINIGIILFIMGIFALVSTLIGLLKKNKSKT